MTHKSGLKRAEREAQAAQARAAAAEILLPEEAGYVEAEGMEATYQFKQHDLKAAVDINTARSIFNFSLPELGPYCIDFSRNGRWLTLGGRKGHLALVDTLRMDVVMEVQLRDTIRDVCALHSHAFTAVAQSKYVYIYDDQGAEVHALRQHSQPQRLSFLPYHFLLASIGRGAVLRYTDVSIGTLVSEHNTHLGPCDALAQNPRNAVLHAGHSNGVVTLWSPSMGKPLVRMLAHRGPLSSLAVDPTGNYMVTAGHDARVRVWDLRTYTELHHYFARAAPSSMDISQRGLLALGFGCHATVWRDAIATKARAPYLRHDFADGARVERLRFRPYEDALGCGHASGYATLLVPGAGEPNFDTFAANPFETRKQRREGEVKALLDKLGPETIMLDPAAVATVDADPEALRGELRALQEAADARPKAAPRAKNKMRGRNKIGKKVAKKQANVVDAGVAKRREKVAKAKEAAREAQAGAQRARDAEGAPGALAKFYT
ncbi:U3 snoRNP-associated protein Utp7 [Tribonema minus]|uniref:U3 snoRNP-associated protein Utp7 n=1 Tax=Tribonema minus TaxID=303371 RepID=A0A835ZC99_9STRA|nr:U3 snoRNP-associated protein Utp7 [Tribonema minus]